MGHPVEALLFLPAHGSRVDPGLGDGADVAELVVVGVEGELVQFQVQPRVLGRLVSQGHDVDQLVTARELQDISIHSVP